MYVTVQLLARPPQEYRAGVGPQATLQGQFVATTLLPAVVVAQAIDVPARGLSLGAAHEIAPVHWARVRRSSSESRTSFDIVLALPPINRSRRVGFGNCSPK